MVIQGNLVANCTSFGLSADTASIPASPEWDGNAFYSNNGGVGNAQRNNVDSVAGIFGVNPYTNVKDVILTINPFFNATTGGGANFGVNNLGGGGLGCQGAAPGNSWLGSTGSTGYRDMGAVQHKIPKRVEIVH